MKRIFSFFISTNFIILIICNTGTGTKFADRPLQRKVYEVSLLIIPTLWETQNESNEGLLVQVGSDATKDLACFATKVAAMEEVMDLYRMAGDIDYVLRVVVADQEAYDYFYQRLIELFPLKSVTSRFVLENIKQETAFPIRD